MNVQRAMNLIELTIQKIIEYRKFAAAEMSENAANYPELGVSLKPPKVSIFNESGTFAAWLKEQFFPVYIPIEVNDCIVEIWKFEKRPATARDGANASAQQIKSFFRSFLSLLCTLPAMQFCLKNDFVSSLIQRQCEEFSFKPPSKEIIGFTSEYLQIKTSSFSLVLNSELITGEVQYLCPSPPPPPSSYSDNNDYVKMRIIQPDSGNPPSNPFLNQPPPLPTLPNDHGDGDGDDTSPNSIGNNNIGGNNNNNDNKNNNNNNSNDNKNNRSGSGSIKDKEEALEVSEPKELKVMPKVEPQLSKDMELVLGLFNVPSPFTSDVIIQDQLEVVTLPAPETIFKYTPFLEPLDAMFFGYVDPSPANTMQLSISSDENGIMDLGGIIHFLEKAKQVKLELFNSDSNHNYNGGSSSSSSNINL